MEATFYHSVDTSYFSATRLFREHEISVCNKHKDWIKIEGIQKPSGIWLYSYGELSVRTKGISTSSCRPNSGGIKEM